MGHFHAAFNMGSAQALTDSELLGEFATGGARGAAAFEILVARHGPMVHGVCRRVLGDRHDVQDAYQATFLVLVRKAGSLRDHNLLANWLYGVASRVSVKARAVAARRRACERLAAERTAVASNDPVNDDLRSVLDEEIGRLPAKYRDPLILCLMEGMRHEDAARQLGCPVGTVESRLSRARERLRERLTRRGLAPMAGGATIALAGPDLAARRGVPPTAAILSAMLAPDPAAASELASSASSVAAGSSSVSSSVASLAEGALAAMTAEAAAATSGLAVTLAKFTVIASGVLAAGIAINGAAAGRKADGGPQGSPPVVAVVEESAPNAPVAADVPEPPAPAAKPETTAGVPERPVLDAPFRAQSPIADGVIAAGEYGRGWVVDASDDRNPGRAYGRLLGKDVDLKESSDLSYRVFAAHTGESLFLAFEVRDQAIDAQVGGGSQPNYNDGVELFLDGDRTANDFKGGPGSREGFQIIADTLGNQLTTALDLKNSDWKAKTRLTSDGYVTEFEIPLGLIDTIDGPGFGAAKTGSVIRFNAAVNDNDEPVDKQTHYSVLWCRATPVTSPFVEGEDSWTVDLRLIP